MFEDRIDAGRKLAAALPPLDPAQTVVIALPRGGVPVAEVIAQAIGAPLDIALVRKVGMPGQEELALAAVADGPEPSLVVNKDVARFAGLSEKEIRALAEPELAEIDRRRQVYLGGRPPVPVAGRTVVVVDDGIATGATMRVALKALRAQGPARLILAVPVAPAETVEELSAEADAVVCLSTPSPFVAVGRHYLRFDQVPDRVVIETLARHRETEPGGAD
jgi:putative phosphoribosyl transferase